MIIFKYKKESLGIKKKSIWRPVADIYLQSCSGSWIELHPYIDSGADLTMLPFSLGKLLGISVGKKKINQIGGIKGSIPVIYHKIKVKIGTKKFTAQVAWALVEEIPPLLGRTDVFDRFKITFKQKNKVIEFE